MTKEFKKRVDMMLSSSDLEMVGLGLALLAGHCSYEECKQLVPGECIGDPLRRVTNGGCKVWIKGDVVVGFYHSYLICRRISDITDKHFFSQEHTTKIYLDTHT